MRGLSTIDLMETQVVLPDRIDLALACLRSGEPVAFPTETVYGLGAPVFSPAAVKRIFEIKGRPADNPLIVHISSMEQASLLGEELPLSFFLLADAFWPGPLALVVKKKAAVSGIVSAGQPTVGIRMPVHPVARRLIDQLGEPLAAPSANLSGRPSPTLAQDVWEDLQGKVSLILDGGPCSIGIESTVVRLDSGRPILLRPGSIRQEEIEEVLKEKVLLPTADTPVLSPGMKYRHYAPRGKLRLLKDRKELQGSYLLPDVTPRNLYASLREADRRGIAEMAILCDEATLADPALMNRLQRASGQIGDS